MIRTNDRPLEKRPDALNGVGVDITPYPFFLTVVHAAHAWWFPEKPAPEHGCFDSSINTILSDAGPREEVCGSVAARGTLCRVYKWIFRDVEYDIELPVSANK